MEDKRRHSGPTRPLRQRAAVIDDAMDPADARTQERRDAPTPEAGAEPAKGVSAGARARRPAGVYRFSCPSGAAPQRSTTRFPRRRTTTSTGQPSRRSPSADELWNRLRV